MNFQTLSYSPLKEESAFLYRETEYFLLLDMILVARFEDGRSYRRNAFSCI